MKSFPLGNQLVLATTFTDPTTGLAANPTTALLELLDPTGVVTKPGVSNPSPGLYKSTYTPTIPGVWTARWEGTGAVVASIEYKFEIRPSAFAS